MRFDNTVYVARKAVYKFTTRFPPIRRLSINALPRTPFFSKIYTQEVGLDVVSNDGSGLPNEKTEVSGQVSELS